MVEFNLDGSKKNLEKFSLKKKRGERIYSLTPL